LSFPDHHPFEAQQSGEQRASNPAIDGGH